MKDPFAPVLPFLAILSTAALGVCQEKYWAAGGAGAVQIDSSCHAHQTVAPTGGRDIAVAPDGKVWIANGAVTILNPDGTLFTTITPTISAYSLAFDRNGHAWVSGTTNAVEQYDPAGVFVQSYVLPATNARQICVDADGNKWIAHRSGPPGSLSRIDGVTGVVTGHPLPATSLILPIGIFADSRGLLGGSHIWTVGDNRGAGEVVEFDSAGNWVSTTVVSASARLQWLSGDLDATGRTTGIWVGDWGNGNLHRVDTTTLAVTTPNTFPFGVVGVTFDGHGDLLVSLRAGTGFLRVDPATGVTRSSAVINATTHASTRWQYAAVVDPLGDLDGDAQANVAEIMGGASPFDGCSRVDASLSTGGTMAIGGTMTLDAMAAPGTLTLVAFATGMAASPLVLPGIGCQADVDPATILAAVALIGPASLNLNIPNDPGFVGFRMLAQALNDGAPRFTNVTPIKFY